MEMSQIKSKKNLNNDHNSSTEKNDKLSLLSINSDTTNKNNVGISNTRRSSGILKPGIKIKPEISIFDVEKLVQRLYGIITIEIKELNAYDDKNYYIREDRNIKNPLITHNSSNGYVLKILNAHESKNLNFVDAQNQMMIFLRKHEFNCPIPIKNVYGEYYSVETLNGNQHVVRLLEFIPGKIFYEVPFTNHLFYQCGEYVAKLDKILKGFHHDAYKSYESIWQLQSVPKLKQFVHAIQDHGRKLIIEEIIEVFESKISPHLNVLEKGIIHGDFNEQNIIVLPKTEHSKDEYKIAGVLDFGDSNCGPLIFELAIAMTYMMLQSKDLATGGLVMAGYSSVRKIPCIEKEILKECIASRLCQSLVLGAYSHSLNPDNDYVLTTQKAGWELLESLWKDNLDKVDELWKNTADHYLMQSDK